MGGLGAWPAGGVRPSWALPAGSLMLFYLHLTTKHRVGPIWERHVGEQGHTPAAATWGSCSACCSGTPNSVQLYCYWGHDWG